MLISSISLLITYKDDDRVELVAHVSVTSQSIFGFIVTINTRQTSAFIRLLEFLWFICVHFVDYSMSLVYSIPSFISNYAISMNWTNFGLCMEGKKRIK